MYWNHFWSYIKTYSLTKKTVMIKSTFKLIRQAYINVVLAIMLSLTNLMAFAQEKGLDVDVDINKKESQWYQQSWVWIVGAAVFILLLVALLRGGSAKRE
jgi:hypothetical protein